jgi:hypothetical protein
MKINVVKLLVLMPGLLVARTAFASLIVSQGCSTLSSEFPVEERIRSGESGSVSILTER